MRYLYFDENYYFVIINYWNIYVIILGKKIENIKVYVWERNNFVKCCFLFIIVYIKVIGVMIYK